MRTQPVIYPPSSARNVDGDGPANMSGDLLGKKSQLDLKSFGVGVSIVGGTVSPWLELRA